MQRWFWIGGLLAANLGSAAEVLRLTEENYAKLAPIGKESDAIIGDYLLRSDQLLAIVGDTLETRNANMTTKNVGGCLIDLTSRSHPNDQLTCYCPGGADAKYTAAEIKAGVLICTGTIGKLAARLEYQLMDAQPFVTISLTYTNATDQPIKRVLADSLRADKTFVKSPAGPTDFFWVHDSWFEQAYGLAPVQHQLSSRSDDRNSTIQHVIGDAAETTIAPGQAVTVVTKVLVAKNQLELVGVQRDLTQQPTETMTVVVTETGSNRPIEHAYINIEPIGSARTSADGLATFKIAPGKHLVKASALGHGAKDAQVEVKGATTVPFALAPAPIAELNVTDSAGQPIAAKLQFIGLDDTKKPDFGPNTQGPGVGNLYYAHNGKARFPVPAGKYKVLISHGVEYDLVEQTVDMKAGAVTPIEAKLVRAVQSLGWISSDIHTHSTPSGDNVTTTHGRVLTLLCEGIEHSPCTEHNRIDTFLPVLKQLGCVDKLATDSGMELTGSPLPLNHQNAFPLVRKPGRQDGGGPTTDPDPEVQIRRLAEWDSHAKKVVQINHPDLGWMFHDHNGDGKHDHGFPGMHQYQNVIEVWGNDVESMSDELLLPMAPITPRGRNNRLVHWLQMINEGRKFVGVANTDAHYTDHAIGWVRNYVRCSTDEIAKITTAEMINRYRAGQVVLTSGPFMEVEATADDHRAGPGDSMHTHGHPVELHVRVQCPNWFDINRVQVLINGRLEPSLNFTRASHADRFGAGAVKFDQRLKLDLKADAHIVVCATGEGLGFGEVMGSKMKNAPPTAISNPIYIDINDDGFKPNGDLMDLPKPTKQDGSRKNLQKQIIDKAKEKKAS